MLFFGSPLGLAGLLASKPTGDVFELEDRLSLNNSCGTRDVCRLPQAMLLPRRWLCPLVCYWTLAVEAVRGRLNSIRSVGVRGEATAYGQCQV